MTNTTDDEIASLCTPSNQILYLQNLTKNFNSCLDQSDNKLGDVCKDCLTVFNTLEGSFDAYQGSGICFEAVDQVKKIYKIKYKKFNWTTNSIIKFF